MDIIKRCLKCCKIYFYIEGNPCPHCDYEEKEFNPFREIFGDDNPFNNMGVT